MVQRSVIIPRRVGHHAIAHYHLW